MQSSYRYCRFPGAVFNLMVPLCEFITIRGINCSRVLTPATHPREPTQSALETRGDFLHYPLEQRPCQYSLLSNLPIRKCKIRPHSLPRGTVALSDVPKPHPYQIVGGNQISFDAWHTYRQNPAAGPRRALCSSQRSTKTSEDSSNLRRELHDGSALDLKRVRFSALLEGLTLTDKVGW